MAVAARLSTPLRKQTDANQLDLGAYAGRNDGERHSIVSRAVLTPIALGCQTATSQAIDADATPRIVAPEAFNPEGRQHEVHSEDFTGAVSELREV